MEMINRIKGFCMNISSDYKKYLSNYELLLLLSLVYEQKVKELIKKNIEYFQTYF